MKEFYQAAQAFNDADETWHAALVARYGNQAGTMRYLVQGQGMDCDAIASAYRARYRAMRAYMAMQQD